MKSFKKLSGIGIVALAAISFSMTQAQAGWFGQKDNEQVHCSGANICKNKSGYLSPSDSDSCKEKGWAKMSRKECEDKGGTVMDSNTDNTVKPAGAPATNSTIDNQDQTHQLQNQDKRDNKKSSDKMSSDATQSPSSTDQN